MAERLLIGAALADSLTRALLPHANELNPVAADLFPALVLKLGLTLALVVMARWDRPGFRRHISGFRHFPGVLRLGAAAWTIGALSNLAIILQWPYHL